jgi:amino acid adenylation domain-containing protein
MNKHVEAVLPLTPLQRGMFFHSLAAEGSHQYEVQFACSLTGRLDVPAFEAAWRAVVDRHQALRAVFVLGAGREPAQVIRRTVPVRIRRLDWSGSAAAETSARWERLLADDRGAGLSLAQAPLFRLSLADLGDDEWRLAWTFHHLLLDGWSVSIVLDELLRLYRHLTGGADPGLPPTRPFADYIDWLRHRRPNTTEKFWTHQLAGTPPDTPLPAAGQAATGIAEVRHALPETLATGLTALARTARTTVSACLLAGWSAVLTTATGTTETTVGVITAGRPAELPGVEAMVGMFVNTLPLRIPVTARTPVRAFVGDVGQRQWAAQEHGYDSLVDIHRWAGRPPGTPLFTTLYAYENYPVRPGADDGAGALRLHDPRFVDHTNYPLTLIVVPGEDGLVLRLSYDSAVLDEPAVRGYAARLERVLTAMTTGPDRALAELPTVDSGTERDYAVWNATTRPYPGDTTLPALFEAQARRTPDAVAVADDHTQVTYRGAGRQARALAGRLRDAGVRPGDTVAVCVGRHAWLPIAHLAVLHAGATCVPLDPDGSPARRDGVLTDAAAAAVLTDAENADALAAWTGPVLRCEPTPDAGPPAAGPAAPVPAGAAYAIYTSGSTGRPKGVLIPHAAVSRLAIGTDYVQITPDDAVLAAANPAFDAILFEIWGALLLGGRVQVMRRDTMLDPEAFEALVIRHRPTVLFVTTALFHALAAAVPGALARLRVLLFGGEQHDPGAVAALLRAGGPGRLLHVYGPTESTTFALWHEVRRVAGPVPIGRPLANTTAYPLDRLGRLVPDRTAGELCIGGAGLAWGYLGQAGRTADAFRPDPYAEQAGARLYRTGDLAGRNADGEVDFRGRADFQVKIRGFRVEPGEIEVVLAEHPEVAGCVVVPQRGPTGAVSRLVGYVVPASPRAGDLTAVLREYLSARLPDYLVPGALVQVAELPLTPNGKIDRAALPAPDAAAATASVRPPVDETERTLASIWREVLHLDAPIGRDQDFFALGGDSLKALALCGRVRKELGVAVPLSVVVSEPTVAAMAELVRLGAGDRPRSPLIRIQRGATDAAPLFCVHPGGGSVLSYVPLARSLGAPQTVYGLEDVTRDVRPDTSIEELAERYLGEVRRVRPVGPYLLAGWSFGGLVAYEMAVRLRRDGAGAALVALLDTGAADLVAGYAEADPALVCALLATELLERPQDEIPGLHDRLAPLSGPERSELVTALLRDAGRLPADAPGDWFAHEVRVFDGRLAAAARYRTPRATGPVSLLRAPSGALGRVRGLPASVAAGLHDETLGWGRHCPELTVLAAPGDHGTMLLEPHVRHVAATLRRLIRSTAGA